MAAMKICLSMLFLALANTEDCRDTFECAAVCNPECKARLCVIDRGVCTDGCGIQGTGYWLTGDQCDIIIPKMDFGLSDEVPTSPVSVTTNSVTWRWKESTDISDRAAPYIGYRIYYRSYTMSSGGWTLGADVPYSNTEWQQGTVSGLQPGTRYQFDLVVYRKVTDKEPVESGYTYYTSRGYTLIATTNYTECPVANYGPACTRRCNDLCKDGCDRESGACTDCDFYVSGDWRAGAQCDIIIPVMRFGAADVFDTTPLSVSIDSVTWRWKEGLTGISDSAAPYIGYRIYYSMYTTSLEGWTLGADVKYNKIDWQQGTVSGLNAGTRYQFDLAVYRIDSTGQKVESPETYYKYKSSYLDVRTLSVADITTRAPTTTTIGVEDVSTLSVTSEQTSFRSIPAWTMSDKKETWGISVTTAIAPPKPSSTVFLSVLTSDKVPIRSTSEKTTSDCPGGFYQSDCRQGCNSRCKRVCNQQNGACEACNYDNNEDWLAGDQCDVRIPKMQFGSSDYVQTTPVSMTADSVTWRWKEGLNNYTDRAAPYIGYRVYYRLYTTSSGGWSLGADVPYSHNEWQQATVSELQPETRYQFDLAAYRVQSDVKKVEGVYRYTNEKSALEATTKTVPSTEMSISSTTTSVKPTSSHKPSTTIAPIPEITSKGTTWFNEVIVSTSTLVATNDPQTIIELESGHIAGIVVACVVLIALAAGVLIFVVLRRRKKSCHMCTRCRVHGGGKEQNDAKHGGELLPIIPTEQIAANPDKSPKTATKTPPNPHKPEKPPKPSTLEKLKKLSTGIKRVRFPEDNKVTVHRPANETPSLPSPPSFEPNVISVDNLKTYIDDQLEKSDGFKEEFRDIPGEPLFDMLVGRLTENHPKNRFNDITAYDYNRVVLDIEESARETDYINASYITGYNWTEKAYIASQGPRPQTTRDMWRMIWQSKANRIVMLTKFVENKKRKCERYWPEKVGGQEQYGNYRITTVSRDTFTDYNLCILNVCKRKESRTVRHMQFLQWPDKKAPEQAYPLLAFRRKVRSFDSVSKGPMIVHCSAGVGRTGTFIALDCLIQQADAEGKVDVFSLVNCLRRERLKMVQTKAQYEFVYKALLDNVTSGNTSIPCGNLQVTLNALGTVNENKTTPLGEQFEILNSVKATIQRENLIGLLDENADKNRNDEIVPRDDDFPVLKKTSEKEGTYINAVYVDTYLKEKAMIATQMPLSSTMNDFWRLVYQQKASTIVLLDKQDGNDSSFPRYWPDDDEYHRQMYGGIQVEIILTKTVGPILVREFQITEPDEDDSEPLTVRQFQLSDWPDTSELPEINSLLDLLDTIESWMRDRGPAKPIIVQCMDGAMRSGLFCAANCMLEKMKVDQAVDVFLSLRYVSDRRPQFVNSLAQYRYLHELALHCMSRYATYANFQ